MQLFRHRNHEHLSQEAAAWLGERARQAIANRGRFLACLCGGSTPPRAYELWAQADLPWDRVHVFWGDERWRGEAGNHYETTKDLFSPCELHPWPVGGADPEAAAAAYEAELQKFFGDLPQFDVAVQGLGADGHTASLFPDTPGLLELTRWTVAHYVPGKERWRLSLTYPVLGNSRELLFLVTGPEKKDTLAAVLAGADLPATRLVRLGQTHVFCDQAAAPE